MTANVTIVSPMRDFADGLPAYRQRVTHLDHPADSLRFVVVEGDSTDNTRAALLAWASYEWRLDVAGCDTGQPRYGSIIDAARFRVLAQVFNAGLDAVDLAWSSHVLFLPCDVEFEQDLLGRLLARGLDLVAPFFWMPGGKHFYDTWGFIRDGQHFGNFHHTYLPDYGTKPIPMDTVGGAILMRADILRDGARYTPEEVDHGLCKAAKALGYGVWADPTTHITHL